MIIHEKKDSLKFDFSFRAEKSSPHMIHMRTSSSSNPTTPTTPTSQKHNYNDMAVYYVCRDFFASTPEHLSVFVDDELEIIEEISGGSWTRVRERDSMQTGLIPTEILESGPERLAKENKSKNQDTIRFMSCRPDSNDSSSSRRCKSKSGKTVSFCESDPEILNYPPDDTNDHTIFPFTLNEEDISDLIASTDELVLEDDSRGFLNKIFHPRQQPPSQSARILETLKSFERYPDHLIRVYTGNYSAPLHAYKTFIVDEELTFAEFSHMVLCTFELELDAFVYEINLVNHLTAEVVPIDTDFTIERVIEITKREGLSFASQMPRDLRKAQKGALKKLLERNSDARDKSTDYVTPFKFVLNRIYSSSDNVPIYVHVSLAYNSGPEDSGPENLLIQSLFDHVDVDLDVDLDSENLETTLTSTSKKPQHTKKKKTKKKKWYHKILGKSNTSTPSSGLKQQVHRILILTQDPLHTLIHRLLESLQVPPTLPGIAFEAFLPAIHDAIELPLPVNMPVGDVMRIRPKLDQAEQVITIRPVIIRD